MVLCFGDFSKTNSLCFGRILDSLDSTCSCCVVHRQEFNMYEYVCMYLHPLNNHGSKDIKSVFQIEPIQIKYTNMIQLIYLSKIEDSSFPPQMVRFDPLLQ